MIGALHAQVLSGTSTGQHKPCCQSSQQRCFGRLPVTSLAQRQAVTQSFLVTRAAAEESEAVSTTSDENDRSTWVTGVARLRGIRGSPNKFRRVIDQIRGRSYNEALFLLDNLPYRACEDILSTLISAASNAKNNSGATKRNLVVDECYVDDAGMYKRFAARAKGRPARIEVKKSHITIKVREYPDKCWTQP